MKTLEQRRIDVKVHVVLMFKIIHGLVAIPVPPYFEQPMPSKRHSHPLALRQVNTAANYYKFAFSLYFCLLESTSSPDRTYAHSGSVQKRQLLTSLGPLAMYIVLTNSPTMLDSPILYFNEEKKKKKKSLSGSLGKNDTRHFCWGACSRPLTNRTGI